MNAALEHEGTVTRALSLSACNRRDSGTLNYLFS